MPEIGEQRSALEILATAFHEAGVEPLLIGGRALECHGYARATLDIDWLLSDEEIAPTWAALEKLGYTFVGQTENFARYTHPGVLPALDLLYVNAATKQSMASERIEKKIGDARFWVVALHHLIALKLHALRNNPKRMGKDDRDIVELLNFNPGVISDAELKKICEKYGPLHSFDKIKAAIP